MNPVSQDPLDLLHRLRDEVNRVVGTESGDTSRIATSHWSPAVDIREEADRFVLIADLPGIEPADIEVTMEAGMLTIKGERKFEPDPERAGYRRVERSHGSFHRRFSLPDSADAQRVTATARNGVLEIVIPKHPRMQSRRVVVEG